MGYDIRQLSTRFRIRLKHFPAALSALQLHIAGTIDLTYPYSFQEYFDTCNENWFFTTDFDTGDIEHVTLVDEAESHEDYRLFAILAPYVEPGSFITIVNDAAVYWQWQFRDGKLYEVDGVPVFPGEGVEVHSDDRE
jgi:hypothetical protein